ncbi:hypothetical protein H5410_001809 [Solanum commersonii]|uniref:Uncharacterized protein n=1 Tax=Solanum commersonii TaxID=4109 RepID=A0A9J6B076_SOLCO|nr:hypothetical protein H5410_001809 [Solanum commersonii]
MTTTQSFVGVASSSNMKCSSCLCKKCEQQHDYLINHVKELTNIFNEMTYNINAHTSKKISQSLKCMRLKKSIFQSLCIISKRKKTMTTVPISHSTPKVKENENEKEKEEEEEEKMKEKENCDVKQQYPFEGFNIDGEGPTELMSSFSQ